MTHQASGSDMDTCFRIRHSVQGCPSWGLVDHHSEIQLSKRAGDWIAYISVGSEGYNDVVIVNRVKLCNGK
jgi:hypothetical protein